MWPYPKLLSKYFNHDSKIITKKVWWNFIVKKNNENQDITLCGMIWQSSWGFKYTEEINDATNKTVKAFDSGNNFESLHWDIWQAEQKRETHMIYPCWKVWDLQREIMFSCCVLLCESLHDSLLMYQRAAPWLPGLPVLHMTRARQRLQSTLLRSLRVARSVWIIWPWFTLTDTDDGICTEKNRLWA